MRNHVLLCSLRELIANDFRLFFREPVAVFFSLVFPLLPLLIFGVIFGQLSAGPRFRVIDVYLPAVISMVIGYTGLMSIPIALSEFREEGVLRRYQVSPISLARFLVSHVTVQFCLCVAGSVIVVVAAEILFNIRFAGNPLLVALGFVLSCAAMFTLGFAVVAVCSGPRTTQATGSILFFLMLFTSGAAVPRMQFPPWLQRVTEYLPLTHVVNLMTQLWVGEPVNLLSRTWTDQPPGQQAISPLVLLGCAALFFLVARRGFPAWR
jgi:ABC-2 type transport system permease protein